MSNAVDPQRVRPGFLARNWDLLLSIVGTAAFALVLFLTRDELVPPITIFIPAIGAGVAIVGLVVQSQRWASDRLKDSDLGSLYRLVDEDEKELNRTFLIPTLAGCALPIVALLGLVTSGALNRTGLAIFYCLCLSLTLYGLLGFISLILLNRKISEYGSRLQTLKEQADRLERELKGKSEDGESASEESGKPARKEAPARRGFRRRVRRD